MTTPFGLTARQTECLAKLQAFQAAHGRAPSFSEVATMMGVRSRSNAKRLLDALQERGYIARLPYRANSMVLIEPESAGYRLPPDIETKLASYCAVTGQDKAAVVIDAVAAHLDELGERVPLSALADIAMPVPIGDDR